MLRPAPLLDRALVALPVLAVVACTRPAPDDTPALNVEDPRAQAAAAPAAQNSTPPADAPPLPAEGLAALSAEVASYVERDLAVGAELLVLHRGDVALHEVYGHVDREKDELWTKGTVCNVRSMTKPLTGAAAQILIDRGELGLDDRVAEHLPGFDTDASRAITVRQLLTHRSGLPLTTLTSMDEHESLFAMANATGAGGPEFEVGSKFWYSDAGSDALAAVVEVVSGTTIDAFVRAELLEPLGMTESFYFVDDDDPRRGSVASLYVGGPGRWDRFLDPDEGSFYPYAWGSQTLYSTPLDYARFLRMWLDGGTVGDRRLLSEAAVERTLTPVSEMTMLGSDQRFPTSFPGHEVAYGQMAVLHVPTGAASSGPARIVGHSGSDGTIAWAWPGRDLMVLYFTQSRGGGSALRLEEAVERLLLHPELYDDDAAVPEAFRPYVGTYIADWSNHMKEEFVVKTRGDTLQIDVPSQMIFDLVPADEDERWHFAITDQITVWFERDEDGAVDALRIAQGPLVFEAPRKGTPREARVAEANRPDPDVVGPMLGKYHDPEEDVDVEVLVDGDYLAVRTPEITFHLWKVPVADVWQVRQNPAMTLTFQEEDGEIVSFTRHGMTGSTLVFPRVE